MLTILTTITRNTTTRTCFNSFSTAMPTLLKYIKRKIRTILFFWNLTSGPSSCRLSNPYASSNVCAFNRWYCSRSRSNISLDFCSVCETAFCKSFIDWRFISRTVSSRQRKYNLHFLSLYLINLLFVELQQFDLQFVLINLHVFVAIQDHLFQ